MGFLSGLAEAASAAVTLTSWMSKLEREGEAVLKLAIHRHVRGWHEDTKLKLQDLLRTAASGQTGIHRRQAAEVCEIYSELIRH